MSTEEGRKEVRSEAEIDQLLWLVDDLRLQLGNPPAADRLTVLSFALAKEIYVAAEKHGKDAEVGIRVAQGLLETFEAKDFDL